MRKLRNLRIAGVATLALASGGALAFAVTGAEGQYTPTTSTSTSTTSTSTTTTTSTTPIDNRLPFSLKGTAGKQKLSGKVKIKATCPEEPCFVSAHGKMAIKIENRPDKKFKLGNDFDSLGAGGSTTLVLKVPKNGLKKAKKLVTRKDTKVKAKVRVEAKDQLGFDRKKDRRIKLVAK